MDEINNSPFYLENGRAMISLGPVSPNRHCSFKCPFCYVKSESFVKYVNWGVEQTIEWLNDNSNEIQIIYISGDTDSFAPPRTNSALNLLEQVSFLQKDVLFTTRYLFEESHLNRLNIIGQNLKRTGNLSIACTSVCQLSHPHLEPKPIRDPQERIWQIGRFKEAGWIPVLAMRPIMPNIPGEEYSKIIELASDYTDLCLISSYYYDPNSEQIQPNTEVKHVGKLFFDIGDFADWVKVDPQPEVISSIMNTAEKCKMNIFEQSSILYSFLKQKQ